MKSAESVTTDKEYQDPEIVLAKMSDVEIEDAYNRARLYALRRLKKMNMTATDIEFSDYANEAFARVASGKRQWLKGTDLVDQLINVINSLISNEHNLYYKKNRSTEYDICELPERYTRYEIEEEDEEEELSHKIELLKDLTPNTKLGKDLKKLIPALNENDWNIKTAARSIGLNPGDEKYIDKLIKALKRVSKKMRGC